MSRAKKRKEEPVNETIESRIEDRHLYCTCKMPDDPDRLMVQCNFCTEWYHPSCIGIDEDDVTDQAKWHCPSCIEIMSQNPMISKQGLLGFQGRVAPSKGWNDEFPVQEIDERIIFDNVETKRHRIEGWTLHREGRVTSLSSNTLSSTMFFRAQCQAAMKLHSYIVYVCLKDDGMKLKWSTCSCPAGIDGQCKHVVACLYLIIEIHREGLTKIPDIKTCTDKLQMWHVRKPTSDEPLLFSDITFVKHDPEKPVKRDLSSNVKTHNPVPNTHKSVTENDLKRLVATYQAANIHFPVLETIRSNNFAPVQPKQHLDGELHTELFDLIHRGTAADLSPVSDTVNSCDSNTQRLYSSAVYVDFETNTRLQSKSAFWFQQRQYRLTASMFGTFCRIKSTTDPVKVFCQKRKFFTTRSVRHGINYESQALAKYLEHQSNLCETQSCGSVGLIVNPEIPFLAASPDGLVKVDGEMRLVEIKCPYSLFQKKAKIREQLKEKSFYLHQEKDGIKLKSTHDYYFQIQGQLNIAQVNQCDLVVFVPPEDIVVINIKRDIDFFQTSMLPKLLSIYFENLLPHFVSELQSVHI